ncbi:hypothetical protein PPYR_02225 [Photinus pyralis]|uniref:Actin maturation protease n=1 Tax=Photinus pyralis TaxID=7054 RepID=A0A5N4B6N5_PHOPY|nr:UPF0692 protein CG33108 [Photinus pyralis]XP_031329716.1 UPF0692 protein CG33108 [Photinus pyralis]KAB0805255.1 hypothetical protein PPYR_02225 [Photinus pyralis]
MQFEWALKYPELYNFCLKFNLSELNDPIEVSYTNLEGILQEGPQCGLVALAICMRKPTKDTVEKLLTDARNSGYTYNGELFSAAEFLNLVQKHLPENEVSLYSGFLDSNHVISFLLKGGLMLVPYDCDKNHTPCNLNGHKAHWAAIIGVIVTSTVNFVIAKHGKSKNLAVWNIRDLAESNSQLVEFSEDRKLSNVKYKLPINGIGEENGLKCKSIWIAPTRV